MSATTSPAQSIEVLRNIVAADADAGEQARQVANRAAELNDYAHYGYVLIHTAAIPGNGHVLFVDTLTRPAR